MKQKSSKLLILATIFLLVGCSGGGVSSNDDFSYSEPDPYIPPTLDPKDYDFGKNNILKDYIVSIGKTSGATLTNAEIDEVLNKVPANDMHINKVERESVDNYLYDFGANDVGENIILDKDNYRIRETEVINRNDALCIADGDLTYFKEAFEEATINATGTYSLSVDLDTILINETKDYDVDLLDVSNQDVFTISYYKEYLNLVHSDAFIEKMQEDYEKPVFNDYDKSLEATLGNNTITISQVMTKTILHNGETSIYSSSYEIIIEDGVISKTTYNYQEKDEFDTVFREILEVEQYSHEIL